MDVNKLRQEAQKLTGKAETFIKDHHDQIETTVTKAETFAKSKTKTPKRGQQIDKVADKLRGLIPSDEPKAPKAAKKPKPAGEHGPAGQHKPAGEHKPAAEHKPKETGPGSSGVG